MRKRTIAVIAGVVLLAIIVRLWWDGTMHAIIEAILKRMY